MKRTLSTDVVYIVHFCMDWLRKREALQAFELTDVDSNGAITMEELQDAIGAEHNSPEDHDVLEQVWIAWSGAMAAVGVSAPTKLKQSGWRKLGLATTPALDAALFSMSFMGAKGAVQESRSIWRPRRRPPISFLGTTAVTDWLEEHGTQAPDIKLCVSICGSRDPHHVKFSQLLNECGYVRRRAFFLRAAIPLAA